MTNTSDDDKAWAGLMRLIDAEWKQGHHAFRYDLPRLGFVQRLIDHYFVKTPVGEVTIPKETP